ncbi:endonuclease domain-containing protein [Altererythrobacter aquiaggeris]|uniref:endonuclease domain-containing protein n=1 Tax=Aestuarierythrobacter aquiaggeris TaxID=1898396 RepID=UPI003015BE01
MLARAAAMRNNPAEPERRLWMALHNSRLSGYTFRRQSIAGYRIIDFCRPSRRRGIEVDGNTHDRAADNAKDRSFTIATSFAIIRFTNEEVMRNMNGVISALEISLKAQPVRWNSQAND